MSSRAHYHSLPSFLFQAKLLDSRCSSAVMTAVITGRQTIVIIINCNVLTASVITDGNDRCGKDRCSNDICTMTHTYVGHDACMCVP